MDIKQALAILDLSHDACLEDAKASFRILAKKYHPDKLRIAGSQLSANKKMQEINLAFHILNKNLKPKKTSEPKPREPVQTTTVKKTFSFQNLKALFKKIHTKFIKTKKVKTKQKKSQPSDTFKSTAKKGNFVKKNRTFDDVFNKTIKSSLSYNANQMKSTQTIRLKNSYSKYMELKQKMRSKRKYINSEGFTPIEKISPIPPIKKI